MQKYMLPNLQWDGPEELEISLPDAWDVDVCNIAGYDRPALSDEQIDTVVRNPIGMKPLRDIARGKKNAVILFDDLTRGTKPANIVPHILAELAEAGIADENIRFICALGAHAPLDRMSLVKKLGEDVVKKYAVYNHNPFDSCVHVGTTSYGTEVYVNAEYMQCDLKISVASMVPHPFTVFGGGGKIILPGICSMETMMANHCIPMGGDERSDWDINTRRLDMEEAAALAGLDMLVECILNGWGQTCSLYAGALDDVRDAAAKEAKEHYLAKRVTDMDIIILNAYIKASEAGTAARIAQGATAAQNADVVMIGNPAEGPVLHYLMGSWGKLPAEQYRKYKINRPVSMVPKSTPEYRTINFSQYPVGVSKSRDSLFCDNWTDVLKLLTDSHSGKAKVALYPNATIAYLGGF